MRPLPRSASAITADPTTAALRALGLAVLALTTFTETLYWAGETVEAAPGTLPGIILILASQALCLPALLARRVSRALPWLLLAMIVGGMTLCALQDVSSLLVYHWTPGYWALPPMALALTALGRRGYSTWAVVALLSIIGVMPLAGAGWDRPSIGDALFVFQPIAEVLLLGDALFTITAARDDALRREREAQAIKDDRTLEAQARREAARLLHDHVLHALHALSRSSGLASRSMLVEECRNAHDAMVNRPVGESLLHVEDLIAEDPALPSARGIVRGQAEPLPSTVAIAIQAAAHEALANVARHAQAGNCHVEVRQEGSGVRVDVIDDGRGFDLTRRPVGRLGIGRSIIQRMDDVGGQAHTVSEPGRGTRVTLQWPAATDESQEAQWLEAPEMLTRARLTSAAWPGLITSAVLSVVAGSALHPAWFAISMGLLLTHVGTLCAVELDHRPLSDVKSGALLGAAVLGWLLNLLLVPEPPAIDFMLWMAWGSSTVVHLMVLSMPPSRGRWVVGFWLVFQTGTFLLQYHDFGEMWELSSTITAGAGDPAITLLAIAVATRVVAQEAAAARVGTQLRLAAARLQLESQLDHYWSSRVTQEALPLLESVAAGKMDPTDPQVAARAQAMEAALRDELVLGPSNAGLIARLASARRAGWMLTSTLTPDDSPRTLARADELVELLGVPGHAGQRVTLSGNASSIMAVVLDATREQQERWLERLDALDGRADLDPGFTRLGLPTAADVAPGRAGALAAR